MIKLAFYTQTYNSVKYMRKSIESVLNQTYKDFVYYIADDLSTDNTREILQEYANNDSRIQLIFPTENNMMKTTNDSLKIIYDSDCTHLCTLDSDDWYDVDFAETVLKQLDIQDSDLICVGTKFIRESTGEVTSTRAIDQNLFLQKEDFHSHLDVLVKFFITHWAKLYKIEKLKNNSVFMDTSIFYGADTAFVYDLLPSVNSIAILGGTKHNYLSRITSASHKYQIERKKDVVKLFKKQEHYFMSLASYDETQYILTTIFLSNMLDGLALVFYADISHNVAVDTILDYFNDPLMKESLALHDYICSNKYTTNTTVKRTAFGNLSYIADKIPTILNMANGNSYRKDELFNIFSNFIIGVGEFWTVDSLKDWCSHEDVTKMILNGNFNNFDELTQNYNDNDFLKQVRVFLYVTYNVGQPCVTKFSDALDSRQLRYIAKNNSILSKYFDFNMTFEFQDIFFQIMDNNTLQACQVIVDLVLQNSNMKIKDFKTLSLVLKDCSAICDNLDYFIYAHQMDALAAIQENDQLAFNNSIDNLTSFGVDPEIIETFKSMFH